MAWIVRVQRDGVWKRVRTIKNPRGIFLTRADANVVADKLEGRGEDVHIHAASVPVPQPPIVRSILSPSHGFNQQKLIVLHSTESHDRPDVSDVEGILNYLKEKGYGVHYVIDGDGNVGKGAKHAHLVYHAAGANSIGIGIEQVGFASWSTRRWLWDPVGSGRVARKQLGKVAELIAYIADQEGIPLRRSTIKGVCMHSEIPEGGHWDPGPGYPIGYVLRKARAHRRKFRGRVYQ